VYFPVISQPGFGLVRTAVKDSNDTDRGQASVRCPNRHRHAPPCTAGSAAVVDGVLHRKMSSNCMLRMLCTANCVSIEQMLTWWLLLLRYLDSDGVNGYANSLLAGNTSNNPTYDNVARTAPIDAMDGGWHMVTVTSWGPDTPGYR
jgi:hypothetical protein